MPPPLSILFAGAGAFGLPTLRHLAASHRVTVVSQPDKPAGRGKKLSPSAISQLALELNLPLIRTADINREPLPPADVMVVIAFGQKIAPQVVAHAKFGAINLHASRLPKYRGAAPIHHALLNGETIVGNSIIRLAEKMDAGNVLAMSELPVGLTETTGELHDRLADDGVPLIDRVLTGLAAGTAVETVQNHAQATLAGKLSRESTRLDWSRDATAIANQIRAFYPWPGCRVRLTENEKEIGRLTLASMTSDTNPFNPAPAGGRLTQTQSVLGTILPDLSIGCGTGTLLPHRLQPEAGRLMTFADYRNGRPWPVGARLESIL